jgi:hypothetical protein
MTVTQEVLEFTREYINNPNTRTRERRDKIRSAYRELTGENLTTNCSTCLIETLFKIKKLMEKQPCKYLLKPGALLQAFSDVDKTCTNANLTDELAEWHLKHNPGTRCLFSRIPEEVPVAPESPVILPAVESIPESPVFEKAKRNRGPNKKK